MDFDSAAGHCLTASSTYRTSSILAIMLKDKLSITIDLYLKNNSNFCNCGKELAQEDQQQLASGKGASGSEAQCSSRTS